MKPELLSEDDIQDIVECVVNKMQPSLETTTDDIIRDVARDAVAAEMGIRAALEELGIIRIERARKVGDGLCDECPFYNLSYTACVLGLSNCPVEKERALCKLHKGAVLVRVKEKL